MYAFSFGLLRPEHQVLATGFLKVVYMRLLLLFRGLVDLGRAGAPGVLALCAHQLAIETVVVVILSAPHLVLAAVPVLQVRPEVCKPGQLVFALWTSHRLGKRIDGTAG